MMIRRTLLLALAVVSLCSTGLANDARLRALLEAGQQHLLQQQFYKAEAYFIKAMELDQDNAAAHYYLADCKRRRFHYTEALSLYQAAHRFDATTFPLAEYYVALMQKQTGAPRIAQRSFMKFIAHYEATTDPRLQQFVDEAQKEIEGIKLLYKLTLQSHPNFSFRKLPSPLNSPYHDYAPHILSDDSSLLISSTRSATTGSIPDKRYGEHLSDLFLYKKQQGQWTLQTGNLLTMVNTTLNEGSAAFNKTHDQLYFTGCYQDSTCRLLVSQRTGGKWSEPLPLNSSVNLPGYNTKHPALSPSGDTLYFTSDRPGGYGQFDIWMSVQVSETWQPPANLGLSINTSGNEVAPQYYADERALLFASDGHGGIGGYDLFVAHYLQSDRSAVVTNLGLPFNSSQDDLYMNVGRQEAFLTSNRGNEDGNLDLYTFQIQANDIAPLARRQLNPSADWYTTQLSPTKLFGPEEHPFYEQLPLADKVKVTHYVEYQSFREAVSQQISAFDTVTHRYEALSTKEQAFVRRLARAKQQFTQREYTEGISPEDRQQYERLSLSEKNTVEELVDQQWFKQLLQESAPPAAEAVYFYEKLPIEERQKVAHAVRKQQILHQQTFTEQPTLEDMLYYQSLPSEEKTAIEQMITAQQLVERVWAAKADPEMDYVYQRLTPAEQQQIKSYVSSQSFRLAQAESAVLSKQEAQRYETLSLAEKESVRRLANMKKQFLMKEPVDVASRDDQRFYERLPAQEKEVIARIIDAQVFALLVRDEATSQSDADLTYQQLPPQDQQRITQAIYRRKEFHQRTFEQLPTVDDVFTYQTLSDEKRTSVRRLAKAQPFAIRQPTVTVLDQETKLFYEKLPRSDQESIGQLVEHRKKFLLKGTSSALSLEDQYFVETLTTEEKQLVKRVIEAKVFDALMNEEMQITQLTFRYQNLYGRDKQRVDRLAQSRRFFSRAVAVDTSAPLDPFSLQKIAEHSSERADISGRLSALKPGQFPSRAFLVDDQLDTLATTPVNPDGTFFFTRVPYQENHRVTFDHLPPSFSQRSVYEVEELSIVSADAPQELAEVIQFDTIYFATNQHTLPTSATATLDSVVRFHRRHPEADIEIRAFADSTGTRNYNLELTRRRAHSAQQYLVERGVNPICLSQLAIGAVSDRDLALCRRVELSTKATVAFPATRTIYVIQAQPDLPQLAERYRIPLEKLVEWNGESEQVAPYTPIRIVVEEMK